MKQTAVEFLVDEFKEKLIGNNVPEWVEKIIQQAKEMEKEQIIDASYYGHLKGWVDDGVENSYGEQYYNETFKSE